MATRRGTRSGRGGPRQGQPGKAYTNRSDLNQAPRAATGQTYGVAGAQLAAQRAVPVANRQAQMAAPGSGAATAPAPVPLDAPTARPGEPLTAGIGSGPGAGPEALMTPTGNAPDDDVEATLRAIYRQFPNNDVGRLLAEIDMKRR